MLSFPDTVHVYEVGPRDGLQNEATPVSTDDKVELIERLAACGLPYVETSSFVHPRWIPQLGDAEQVYSQIERRPGVRYAALVPNLKGLERAAEVGVTDIAVFVSASESHNERNLNRTIAQTLQYISEILLALRGTDVWVRGYISMVFGCPYEGHVPVDNVRRIANRLVELGVDQLSFGDTVGYGTPRTVSERVRAFAPELSLDRVALHFHDTRGTALANAVAGLDAGVRIFDTSIGGIGGCPYAPGASGNLATEDLVQMLHSMGIETGVDLDALLDAALFIEQRLRKRLPGRYLRAARGGYGV